MENDDKPNLGSNVCKMNKGNIHDGDQQCRDNSGVTAKQESVIQQERTSALELLRYQR